MTFYSLSCDFDAIALVGEGIGIEPDLPEKVFEPFQQGNESLKGAGLGLASWRGLVGRVGCRIGGMTISFSRALAV